MESKLGALEHRLKLLEINTERRLNSVEKSISKLNEESKETSTFIAKVEVLLNAINESISRLENANRQDFELVHKRINSVKKDYELNQQQELQSYGAYKKLVMGTIITAIVGALIGATLTSFKLYG